VWITHPRLPHGSTRPGVKLLISHSQVRCPTSTRSRRKFFCQEADKVRRGTNNRWRCLCGSADVRLHLSISDSDVALVPSTSSEEQIGSYHCRAPGCPATFRQACQLAAHYEECHPCVFGPPRDEDDLDLYNKCMRPVPSTASGKRKRRTRRSGGGAPKKRARTKSR